MASSDLRVSSAWGSALGFYELAEKTLRAKLAYRLATLTSVVAAALGYSVFLLVWVAVYREDPAGSLVPKSEMFPYLLVGLVFNATFSLGVESRFGLRLRQGSIAIDLLRPIGFFLSQLAQAIGDALGNLLFSLPLYALGIAFLGRTVLPSDGWHAVLGLASLALAFLISFGMSYFVMQISFVTHSQYGVIHARLALHQAFSGLAAPLAMFPERLRRIAECLPFRDIIETPVRIWLGQVPLEATYGLLLRQCSWALGVLVVSMSLFQSALRRHQIQGG